MFQVHIHNPLFSVLLVFPHLTDCIMCAPLRPEPVAELGELRIKNRGQYLTDRLLNQTVNHHLNTKLTLTTDRFGLKVLIKDRLSDDRPVSFQEGFGVGNCSAVYVNSKTSLECNR